MEATDQSQSFRSATANVWPLQDLPMVHTEANRRGGAPNAAARRSATTLQKQLFARVWWPESDFDGRGWHAGAEP